MISEEAETQIRKLLGEIEDVVTLAALARSMKALGEPAPDSLVDAGKGAARPKDASRFFADHGRFYDYLRGNDVLGPTISETEFEGCEAIIIGFGMAGAPISFCAYGLATAYLETANTMQPVEEANWLSTAAANAYFKRMYDIEGQRPSKARELGNLSPGDGVKYHGRGYPQLTGKTNYEKATKKLREMGFDVDLVADPDLALRPDIAAIIMVRGMMEGWFTGRKLADDLPESGPATFEQFRASRDIINGRDRQDDVARFAIDFQTGLLQAGYRGGVS